MTQKQKLELTWIGKDVRPRLEPDILLVKAQGFPPVAHFNDVVRSDACSAIHRAALQRLWLSTKPLGFQRITAKARNTDFVQ